MGMCTSLIAEVTRPSAMATAEKGRHLSGLFAAEYGCTQDQDGEHANYGHAVTQARKLIGNFSAIFDGIKQC